MAIKSETKDSFELLASNHTEPGFCRICLVVKKRVVPLMAQLESEKLFQVFTSVTGIDISTKDLLPKQICYHCKKILLEFHIFRKKCIQADTILKTVILRTIKDEQIDTGSTVNSEENIEAKYVDDDSEPYDGIKTEGEKIDIEPKLHLSRNSTKLHVEDAPTSTNADTKNVILCENNDNSRDTTADLQHLVIPLKEDKQYMQERKLHSCTECDQSFRSAKSLKIHFKVHHTVDSSLLCGQCQESFESEKDLKLHSSLHDKGPPWKCIECDKEFLMKYKFRRHTLRHMDSKRHRCEQCEKTFSEHHSLVRHIRSHSTFPQPRKFACHLCDKRYIQKSGLTAHLLSHSGARPCVCATCGKSFPSARLLASHSRCHTDHKPYACDTCHKTFRHASTLCAHRRTHTGERPYVCACCGKRFLQNSNLTLHMRTHTGEKPYKCTKCDRQFSSSSSLTIHERRHTGYKPYVCTICGKRFVGADIALHMRRHAGAHTHACGACPRRFYSRAALTAHAHVHNGIKPFECALCQKKMTTKSHLVKHLKAHETKKIKQTKQQSNKVTDITPYNCTEEVVIAHEDTHITADNQDTIIITFESEDTPQSAPDNTNILQENCLNDNSVNLVEVNQDQVSLGTAVNSDGFSVVKLYKVDQSLLQISSSGDQVSISNITHTVNASFE